MNFHFVYLNIYMESGNIISLKELNPRSINTWNKFVYIRFPGTIAKG